MPRNRRSSSTASNLVVKEGAGAVVVNATGSKNKKKNAKLFMARRKRQRVMVRRRRTRRDPPALRTERHTVKVVIPYAKTDGSFQRWLYHVKLSDFTKRFVSVYSEFRVTSVYAKYLPNNSLNETGLYAGVFLDKDGFGNFGAATAPTWFPTIVAMPGSKVQPRYVASSYRWRPTEPSMREWRTKSEDVELATLYLCNNGAVTDELGGAILLVATLLTRGMYYNAPAGVAEMINSASSNFHSNDRDEFECVGME